MSSKKIEANDKMLAKLVADRPRSKGCKGRGRRRQHLGQDLKTVFVVAQQLEARDALEQSRHPKQQSQVFNDKKIGGMANSGALSATGFPQFLSYRLRIIADVDKRKFGQQWLFEPPTPLTQVRLVVNDEALIGVWVDPFYAQSLELLGGYDGPEILVSAIP